MRVTSESRRVAGIFHLSISTCAMIGQFSQPYFILSSTKFSILMGIKSFPSISTQRDNKYLNNLVLLVHIVNYRTLFFHSDLRPAPKP